MRGRCSTKPSAITRVRPLGHMPVYAIRNTPHLSSLCSGFCSSGRRSSRFLCSLCSCGCMCAWREAKNENPKRHSAKYGRSTRGGHPHLSRGCGQKVNQRKHIYYVSHRSGVRQETAQEKGVCNLEIRRRHLLLLLQNMQRRV